MADVTEITDRRQDGAILHFLKELPAWCIIGIFVSAFLFIWQLSHDDFVPRIIDGLIGALLTSIVGQASKRSTPNISTDTVKTDSMDNASISANKVALNDDSEK